MFLMVCAGITSCIRLLYEDAKIVLYISPSEVRLKVHEVKSWFYYIYRLSACARLFFCDLALRPIMHGT